MTQWRLDNVHTDNLNVKEIAAKFAGRSTRWKNHLRTEFFSNIECIITVWANVVLAN